MGKTWDKNLADFRAIASRIIYLTKLVVYGGRGSRRLDVDCSTGRRPMERADEPPPPILLYQIGVGCIRGAKGGGVGVGGWGK